MSKFSHSPALSPKIKSVADLFSSNYVQIALLLALGLLIFLPSCDFMPALSTGDHGRDLCAYEQAYHGKLVYKDFYWDYGPLMPYYYAFFLKILGLNIKSILIGSMFIYLGAGFLVYLLLRQAQLSAWMSFGGAFFYWLFNPVFFHTFNHDAGVLCIIAVVYFFLQFLYTSKKRHYVLSLVFVFLLSLIKLNIGLSLLAAYACVFTLAHVWRLKRLRTNEIVYISVSLLFVGGTVLYIYWYLFRGLPSYYVLQCFLASPKSQQCDLLAPASTLTRLLNFWFPPFSFVFLWKSICIYLRQTCLLLAAALICFRYLRIRAHTNLTKTSRSRKLAFLTLGVFSLFLCHEFIFGTSVYKFYWATPLFIIGAFICSDIIAETLRPVARRALCAVFFVLMFFTVAQIYSSKKNWVSDWTYLSYPRGKIFVGNSFGWIATVKGSTDYLLSHLNANETFFCLPYDPLYYFLTARNNPVREVSMLSFINIPVIQEKNIILSLEKRKIRYILFSNRGLERDPKIQLKCQTLLTYINTNYEVVAEFGKWAHEDVGWTKNHAVRILKRKENPGELGNIEKI